jgi:hypothetical protein
MSVTNRRLRPQTSSNGVVIKRPSALACLPVDNSDMSAGVGGFDFDAVNQAARPCLLAVLRRLLPAGERVGTEYVARNPKRADKRPGSFKVNLMTGRWADFATGDKGGDVISLAAYLHDLSQTAAAERLARMLGLDALLGGRRP